MDRCESNAAAPVRLTKISRARPERGCSLSIQPELRQLVGTNVSRTDATCR